MRYLTLKEVLELHRRIIEQSGGSTGMRDIGLLESALAAAFETGKVLASGFAATSFN